MRGEVEPGEVMATVLRCEYRPRVGRAVAFGLPASQHFRIVYNYWVEGELREAEMWSATAIPQGSVFPVRVDLEAAGRLWEGGEDGQRVRGRVLLAVGMAGSLVWLLVLRGCR